MVSTVKHILATNPKARDSDGELILSILQYYGGEFTPEQQELIRSTNFESIRRTRQKLQQEGHFMPSPAVAKRRKLKGWITQKNMPTTKSDKVTNLINKPVAISWMKD